MADKVFNVAFKITERNLHDLLLVLPNFKTGEPTIHAVPPQMLALPAPAKAVRKKKAKKQNVVGPKVRAAMAIKQQWRISELAREIGENKQSVNSAISVMIEKGVAKKVGHGLYMRTKPDPQPAAPGHQGNGAAS